ncbi:MAG: ABC transporter permease subunit [Planctomycetes bacterium]|nr:ABC transporter permease subunit [Planctomycetota bacterium]
MISRIRRLYVFELRKLLAKKSFVLLFLLVIVASILGGLFYSSSASAKFASSGSTEDFLKMSGWMTMLGAFLPGIAMSALLVVFVSSASLSSEFSRHTLKTVLIRPLNRTDWFLAKWLLLVTIAAVLILVVSLTSHLVGGLAFGYQDIFLYYRYEGEIFAMREPVYSYDEMLSLQVTMMVAILLPMISLVSIAYCCSSLFTSPGTSVSVSITTALLVFLASRIFDSLPGLRDYESYVSLSYIYRLMAAIEKHAGAISSAYRETVDLGELSLSCGLWIVIPLLLGGVIFRRRDIVM